jgi:anthranilate synthase component 2
MVLQKHFGVCLGQQAIGEVYGGTLSSRKKYHGFNGKKTVVDDELLFEGLETSLKRTLSPWVVDPTYLKCWKRLFDENGQVMSLVHERLTCAGLISTRKRVDAGKDIRKLGE